MDAATEAKIVSIAEPVIIALLAYALGVACPVIPAPIWNVVAKGVVDGVISLDHLKIFLALNDIDIKTFPSFPGDPSASPAVSNINP